MLGLGYTTFKTGTALGTSLEGATSLFDDSDLTSMFVERDGSGGNPSPGDFVGLQLDKSSMGNQSAAAYIDNLPELSDPDNQALLNATGSRNGDGWDITATGANAQINQNLSINEGDMYRITVAWSGNDEGNGITVWVRENNAGLGTSASGLATVFVEAGSNPLEQIKLFCSGSSASDTVYLELTSIKHIPGQHRIAAADNERPVLDLTNGVYSLATDGVDDGLSFDFDGGAGPADCSVFFAVKTSDDQFIMAYPGSGGGGTFLIAAQDGSVNTTISGNYGTPSYYVNGALQSWSTRGDAHAALATGEFTILECANVDASSTTTMSVGGFSSGTLPLDGNLIGPIIVPNCTDKQRLEVMKYLRSKI